MGFFFRIVYSLYLEFSVEFRASMVITGRVLAQDLKNRTPSTAVV